MKAFKKLFFGLCAIALLSSCEKVIEVELEDHEPQLYIAADLSLVDEQLEVIIGKTSPYFAAGASEMIESATVILSDDQGNSYSVPHQGNGVYLLDIIPNTDRTYTLTANVEGQDYVASSFLPSTVMLNELVPTFQAASGPIPEGNIVWMRYQDPAGESNYYRAVHWVNDTLQLAGEDLIIFDDALNDGIYAATPLFQKFFDSGDVLRVQLIHCDQDSYEYYNSLADIVSSGQGPNGGSAAPGNPNTNWSGGIDGKFTAFSSTELTITIP